ncbi:MAG TPA: MBL fold metallo-hydrolase [Myxococcaceae bacterium]|nr:MBL fold metallo-hydrolase [Myxococcaceae bacterium]
MRSPRFAPAGVLVRAGRMRVVIDGGPGAEPPGRLDAWLVTDARSELIAGIRRLARARGCEPGVRAFVRDGLSIEPRPVRHTAHPTFGYDIRLGAARAVWAPEFLVFPRWARGAPLMFAEAAAWGRRIWFAGRVGGHAAVGEVCASAVRYGVRRLVLAHLGRPTLAALDRGLRPPWGEIGREGRTYRAGASGLRASPRP